MRGTAQIEPAAFFGGGAPGGLEQLNEGQIRFAELVDVDLDVAVTLEYRADPVIRNRYIGDGHVVREFQV